MTKLSYGLDPSKFGSVQRAAYEAAMRQPAKPSAPVAAKPEKSRLAQQFASVWQNIGGQPYTEEWQGIPGRQFRFDYTFLDPDTGRVLAIVEIEGSTRQGGRHQKMAGFENDSIKYFLASVVYGWPIIRITRSILKQPENLVLVRQFIELQLKHQAVTPPTASPELERAAEGGRSRALGFFF